MSCRQINTKPLLDVGRISPICPGRPASSVGTHIQIDQRITLCNRDRQTWMQTDRILVGTEGLEIDRIADIAGMILHRERTAGIGTRRRWIDRDGRLSGIHGHSTTGDACTVACTGEGNRHPLSGRRDRAQDACYRIGVFVHVEGVLERVSGRSPDRAGLDEDRRGDVGLSIFSHI